MASSLLADPAPLFLNQGLLDEPTVIDATVVINTGTIQIGSSGGFEDPVLPYETQNTLVFTNRGQIFAAPGINFLNVNSAGIRGPAGMFYNGPGALISAEFSEFNNAGFGGFFSNPYLPFYGGYLSIQATNIVNRGTLEGFYAGDIQIHGENVDLSASRLGEGPIPFSTYFAGETNFFPESIVEDRWWRYSETGVNPNSLATEGAAGLIVQTPQFRIYTQVVDQPDDTGGPFRQLTLINPLAFINKTQASETNQQFEVVFVEAPDPSVAIDVSWEPGFDPATYPALTAFVRFMVQTPDLLNQGGGSRIQQFVIEDTFGSDPNEVLQLNLRTDNSQKPFNLAAYRAFPPAVVPEFPIGSVETNTPFYPGLFTTWIDDAFPDGMTMTNLVTTNRYATWSAELERYPSSVPVAASPIGNVTNLAGRVMISAKNLNLRNARIQGQSLLSIKTDNLVTSSGAVIDAPLLSYDLGSTNGTLIVQDLATGSPSRFGGGFSIWTTTFTNSWQAAGTNATDDGGGATGTPIDIDDDGVPDGCDTDGDNQIDIQGDCPADGTGEGTGTETVTNYTAIYHVTVIQNNLTTGAGVQLNDLHVRATNVDLRDQLRTRTFSSDAENLTITGSINMFGQRDLTAANMPGLQSLTNLGQLSVPGLLSAGVTPVAPLTALVNAGAIQATGIVLGADRMENAGTILADGGNVDLSAIDFVGDGGGLNAAFDVNLSADNANIAGMQIGADGLVSFLVSGDLSDGGLYLPGEVSGVWGVNLLTKPATGNLLGTTIRLTAPEFAETTSYWAASDLGVSRAGYEDNAAVGVLSLDIGIGGVLVFNPVDGTNAIYVEHLELSDLFWSDFESGANPLILGEGFTLYFASTSENAQPAQLDGYVTPGGGILRWVRDGSGQEGNIPLVTVVLGDGSSTQVPKALREHMTVDSDGDGVVNGLDSSPFDLIVFSHAELIRENPPYFRIEWYAAAAQTYQVQATSDLKSGAWSVIRTVKNNSAGVQRMILEDPLDPAVPSKSYRVVVRP
ncbi:MAG: hypothetical protein J0L84_04860 [Verrucomicrobia bacterium]|nr:hypothetical protein [Verrucomicrobiota bacterium]